MKKIITFSIAALSLLMTSCGTGSTSLLNGSNGAITNIIYDVIGLSAMSAEEVVGTWKYVAPGCAFTSQNALQKAGGHMIASQVSSKLSSTYSNAGISSGNTQFTFKNDNSFSAKLAGKAITGTYTISGNQITMKTLLGLGTFTGYLTRTSNGMSLTFESKKLLTVLQAVGAASGNVSLAAITELAGSYDGLRLGFDLSK